MSLSKLLLSIGLAILLFWALGFVLRFTFALVHIAFIVGLVIVIVSLLERFYESHKKKK